MSMMDCSQWNRLLLVSILYFCSAYKPLGVVGFENNTINVALFKSTSQSSQLDNSSSSDLAVDDDITTCSVTATQRESNWTVDLGDVFLISHIKINTGGNTYFGQDFELYVSTFKNHDGVLCNYGIDHNQPEYVISCFTGPANARTVTVRNEFVGSVTLCDVQVIVCADGFFGLNCTKECHCDHGDLCDKINGKCPELCVPGWSGTDCQSACPEGRFGPSCNKACHCMNSTSCDLQTGECPSGCAKGWLDPACQTEIPVLANAPNMFRVEMTEIVIVFFSWLRFVDPSFILQYQIEYKLSSDVHGDQPWMKGPLVNDTDRFNEAVIVKGLRKNSFYVFRVIPILRLSAEEKIQGVASPESTPFRTKCSSPAAPIITNAYSWTDTSRHPPVAVLSVEWMPLTKEQSNCENILYYEIFYQKQGSDWKNTGAKQSEHAKNISAGVRFSSVYMVRVVAHNNQPLQSSSVTKTVHTPPAPYIPCPQSASPCTHFSDRRPFFSCSNEGTLCCIQGFGDRGVKFCECQAGYDGLYCQYKDFSDEFHADFRCGSREVIDRSLVCDGKLDCIDGSDESECNKEYFETDFLLLTDEKQSNIFQVSLTSGESRPIHSVKAHSKISPKTMDYDPMKKLIYYINETRISGSSSTKRDICLYDLIRKKSITPCTSLSYYADAIAVDNRMIGYFWTYIEDSNFIAEINVKESNIISFVPSPPGVIKAITLSNDRSAGQLYWSQCESGKGKYSIENAQTGKLREHQSVLSNLRSCAKAIAVDSSGGVIYWGEESGDVRSADLKGNNETLIYRNSRASYAGLTIDSQFLYISDSNKGYIQKLDRNTLLLTNLTGPVFTKPGNIKIHTPSHQVDLEQFYEERNQPAAKTTNKAGELSPFWIAVVVCVFLAILSAVVTTGVLIAKKMSNVSSTNAEYELTLPTPYAYEGHYDIIQDNIDDNETHLGLQDIDFYNRMQNLPYNDPEYHIADDRDSTDVEHRPNG